MIWDYELTLTGASLLPVGTLDRHNLAIEFSILNQPSTWYKAGYLYPLINVGGGDIPAQGILIGFGQQVIQIPYTAYKLRFVPVPYLTSPYQLKLFKLPMSINYAPAAPEQLGDEVVTTVNASLTNVVLDPANPTRREGFIVNKSNRNLWVRFGATAATAAAPTSLVPPNSNISIPDNYTGAINGIWSGLAPTLNAEIHQFNAV
jgi:hypothetical protein